MSLWRGYAAVMTAATLALAALVTLRTQDVLPPTTVDAPASMLVATLALPEAGAISLTVDHRMVDLAEDGEAAFGEPGNPVQPLDHVGLPQRPAAIERSRMDPRMSHSARTPAAPSVFPRRAAASRD